MFELKITTFEDFLAFVEIIRGSDPNKPEIDDLTKKLNKDTEKFLDAQEKDANTQQGE